MHSGPGRLGLYTHVAVISVFLPLRVIVAVEHNNAILIANLFPSILAIQLKHMCYQHFP